MQVVVLSVSAARNGISDPRPLESAKQLLGQCIDYLGKILGSNNGLTLTFVLQAAAFIVL